MMVNRRNLPAAVFVLLLATFLRFHLLEAQSFWNDEGNSARLSERSVPAILEGTASDIHPPLYYLALRGWRELAGETEFGLRSLSAYVGVLTVAVVVALATNRYRGAGELGGWGTGEQGSGGVSWNSSSRRTTGVVARHSSLAVAGLLAAVSPVLVYYSQETRMYALLALLAALSAWALLNWLNGQEGIFRPRGWAVAYTILLTAGLYTHYFFPAVIAAQGAVAALWWLSPSWVTPDTAEGVRRERGRRLLAWAGLVAAAVLLYLPWIPIFLRQIGGRPGAPADLAAFLQASSRWLFLGGTVASNEVTWAVYAAVSLALLGVVVGGRRSAAPLLLGLIPIVLMTLVGATDPAFFKFLLVVAPFLAVLMGLAWRRGGLTAVVAAALTVVVLAGSLVSLGNLYTDPTYARADYRGLAARIAAAGHPNAGIILNAPNQWEAFTYYHRDGAPVYPLPRGQPDPAIVEPELARIAAAHDRLYALYWGEMQRDPERVVERWLNAHAFKAAEEWVGDVRFVVYAVPREMTATAGGATFAGLDGETITLHEYAFEPGGARPGEIIPVRLAWSADSAPARPYKVFVHLLDSTGNVVAQSDSEPVSGFRPTTTWAPGEVIVDNRGILLPDDLPPDVYELRVGLYDAFDPSIRLPVEGGDSLLLGSVGGTS